jgi:hypothetical protein
LPPAVFWCSFETLAGDCSGVLLISDRTGGSSVQQELDATRRCRPEGAS